MTRCVTTMSLWDAGHYTDEQRQAIVQSYPPHERDARTKGIPKLGAGAIYPIPLEDALCDPVEIPPFWPRAYGMDVGWNRTAVLWGAWDRAVDVLYLYTEHYRGQAEPSIHATAIKARGEWINGVIDPAARGRSQIDGRRLIEAYRGLGLQLTEANNVVEAGIYECWERLSTGRLKVFRTLQNWQTEYGRYRRDENGKIVKERDHLMDAMRYLVMSGRDVAQVQPVKRSVGRSAIADTTAGY